MRWLRHEPLREFLDSNSYSYAAQGQEGEQVMDLGMLQTAIEKAICLAVHGIQVPGIADTSLRTVTVSGTLLQELATRLERHTHAEVMVSAELDLFLRISNTEVLRSVEPTEFRVDISADGNGLSAVAKTDKDWAMAWDRGMSRIRESALQLIKQDILNMDSTLAEDTYTYRATMVLLASELVGPYVDRLASFLGYPRALLQPISYRPHEAGIWEGDEVHIERCFEPQTGGVVLCVYILIAEGKLIRRWSEEEKQFLYCMPELQPVGNLVV
jgi:hypothetical protein